MATEYRVVFLTHGQKAPSGATDRALANGGIVWVGEEETFISTATFGTQLPGDTIPNSSYNHRLMTSEEIDEYNTPLDPPDIP